MADRQRLRFCSSSDGARIAYATTGAGPSLVKAANWLSHLEFDWQSPIWRHWMEALSRNRTYVRYDARGCGLSDRNPAEISFEAWVRDLEAVVDAMKLERFPLLGVSQGGAISVAYAVRHPERVSHLILYGAYSRGRLRRGNPADVEAVLLMSKLFELGWGTDNASFRQVFTSQFIPGASADLMRAFDELQRETTTKEDAIRNFETSAQLDVTELAARVSCPTLVLHARDDQRVPFEEGRLFASLIPGARFVPLPGRNHVLLANEPAWPRFVEEIEAFIGAHPEGPFGALSARERELVAHLARGLDNHQIAAHMGLSEKTVRNHLSSILDKLGLESRAQAIVKAREAGFGLG